MRTYKGYELKKLTQSTIDIINAAGNSILKAGKHYPRTFKEAEALIDKVVGEQELKSYTRAEAIMKCTEVFSKKYTTRDILQVSVFDRPAAYVVIIWYWDNENSIDNKEEYTYVK